MPYTEGVLTKVSLTFLAVAALASAATKPIGIVRASGHFTLEGSQIWGNSTLFDGSTIETGAASSDLALHNGVRVQLGKESKARVWQDRLLLVKGTGQVSGGMFEVDAAGLKISPVGQGAQVRIGMGQDVEVSALSGNARVANVEGVLLASVASGRILSFPMQAAQAEPVTHTGCLLYKDGMFILQDDTTQQILEIHGQDLALNTGNRVEITGTPGAARPAVTIATQIFNATIVSPKSQGGCLSVASVLNAQATAPAVAPPTPGGSGTPAGSTTAKAGGMSTGAKIAIIGAIGGGGAGAAIALAGNKKSTSN